MGLTASQFSGSEIEYERLEGGAYPARCVHVIGLGTHPNDHPKAKPGSKKVLIQIVWELSNELMEDGRPFTVNKEYTFSLGSKANLYGDLVSWRAKAFTDDELNSFALANILDAPCLLSISKDAGKGKNSKKFYNNVKGIMPLPKGMELKERHNPLLDFDHTELGQEGNEEILKQVWGWLVKKLKESEEGKEFFAANPTYGDKPEAASSAPAGGVNGAEDDEIPF
jgi:hypothetical protein